MFNERWIDIFVSKIQKKRTISDSIDKVIVFLTVI